MCAVSRFVLCAAAAAVLAPASFAADPPDLAGTYQCVGDAGGGKGYKGKVEITKEGECYLLKWEITKDKYTGVGIPEGNTLSVAIRQDGNDKYAGVIVYKVEKGGRLVGRWTTFGSKGVTAAETLTPEKAADKEPKADALDGLWELASRTTDGSEMENVKDFKYQVKLDGKTWTTVIKGKATDSQTIAVNAGKTPGTIDRTSEEHKETQLGIYKLDGDTLTTAFGTPNGKRPEKFDAGKGTGVSLSVYKRVK